MYNPEWMQWRKIHTLSQEDLTVTNFRPEGCVVLSQMLLAQNTLHDFSKPIR